MTINFGLLRFRFIADRIMTNLQAATGQRPLMFDVTENLSKMFIVSRGGALALPVTTTSSWLPVRPSTDDWPFLYIRPATFPSGYVAVLAAIALLTVVSCALVFGPTIFTTARMDLPMFFLGAAFLLIETRGVTDLSLLFGSTWIVNAAVFGGVLIVALAANAIVRRWRTSSVPRNAAWLFIPLFAALAVSYLVRPATLLQMPMFAGGVVGALINAVPVGLAGILFSTLLARSPDPAASLGSNLIGAITGGVLEYLSTFLGLRILTLIAAALYGAVLLLLVARRRTLPVA
jgi:hypothetical protein